MTMNEEKYHRQMLIQRYVDQTITSEELSELQELLKSDADMRNELLLYVRMDMAIRGYALFHNYMDEPSAVELPNQEDAPAAKQAAVQHAALPNLDTLLSKVFRQGLTPIAR